MDWKHRFKRPRPYWSEKYQAFMTPELEAQLDANAKKTLAKEEVNENADKGKDEKAKSENG